MGPVCWMNLLCDDGDGNRERKRAVELRQYLSIARKYLWLILLTTVIGGGVAFYFAFTAPPRYRAAATLEINPGADPLRDPLSYTSVYAVDQLAQNYAAKIQSPQILDEVQSRLGLTEMGGAISVEQVEETQFLRISVESGDPGLSQALANTTAQVFIERETAQQQARFQDSLAELQGQIADVEAAVAETRQELATLGDSEGPSSEFVRQERARLESELNRDEVRLVTLLSSAEQFRLAMVRYTDFITIYAPAEMPVAPVGSSTMRNTALGGATGLMIGVSIAFLLEYLDDTIKSPEDVKRVLPVGVLGALPRLANSNGRTPLIVAEHPLQPTSEAFRGVRTNIEFAGVDLPMRVLLVTSPLPTDGKTFTAANLAAVFAQGGKRVVLVDADLRHPRQHLRFELPKEPGLTSVLLRPEERAAVLRETGVEGLRIVVSGPQAPNPAELLASERMRQFVSWLKEEADIVVIDTPPVLVVTDAVMLSKLVDGTILVLDSGSTRRPAAMRAMEQLTGVGAKVLGVVLNRVKPGRDGYYYYYHYYYNDGGDGASANNGRARWVARLLGQERGRKGRRRRSVREEAEQVEERP
jgi:capsular exopolysaccharide synthesis family protein